MWNPHRGDAPPSDQQPLLWRHPHWTALAPAAAISIGLAALAFPLSGAFGVLAGIVAVSAAVGLAAGAVIRRAYTTLTLWPDRISYHRGVIARRGVEIPLSRVNNVLSRQTVIERLIGRGDLIVESAGESGQQEFRNFPEPAELRQAIYDALAAKRERHAAGGAPPAPSAEAGGIADDLSALHDLVERGVLTPEEFELAKMRMLSPDASPPTAAPPTSPPPPTTPPPGPPEEAAGPAAPTHGNVDGDDGDDGGSDGGERPVFPIHRR